MLKLDATLSEDLESTAAEAQRIQAGGFNTAWIGESKYDPFLRSLSVAQATNTLNVGTAVAIAFGRSPLTVASSAYDLARYSGGRFTLGLGSQVKAHIERRFSMPWSQPAARMREFVAALQEIWRSWQEEDSVDFTGDFYNHTLMPPFFRPKAHEFGLPPIYLAAVGEKMTQVAGEVCDGLFFHPFTTVRYLTEVTLPAVARGRNIRTKTAHEFAICGPVLTASGRTEADIEVAIAGVRSQIAFYASTPAYRSVLDLHGWSGVGDELTALTKAGRWAELSGLIDDDMLHTIAVVGSIDEVAKEIVKRFEPLAASVSFSTPYEHDRSIWAEVSTAIADEQRTGS
jgi:probable F420-dependent oxidoreductase